MTAAMFTDDWARAWADELNGSQAYQAAAADWHGSICFKLRSRDPREERKIFLDLQEGQCLAARSATEQDLQDARFILSARERVWRRLVEGRSDPLVVLMTGLIRFEKGRLTDFAGQGKAAQELMRAAQRIDPSNAK
jgi:putative sterol carrier protein